MNIVKAGLAMMLYLFIVIICYYFISGPLDVIYNVFDNINDPNTEAIYNTTIPYWRTAMNLFFSLLAAVPIAWFITWVMSREPDWYYGR